MHLRFNELTTNAGLSGDAGASDGYYGAAARQRRTKYKAPAAEHFELATSNGAIGDAMVSRVSCHRVRGSINDVSNDL